MWTSRNGQDTNFMGNENIVLGKNTLHWEGTKISIKNKLVSIFKKIDQNNVGPIAQILNLSNLYDVTIGQQVLLYQLGSNDQVWIKFKVRVGPIAQNLKLSDLGGLIAQNLKLKDLGGYF